MLTWKYTAPAFLVPFVFTLSDQGLGVLLQGSLRDIAIASSTAAVGVGALAAGFGGWVRRAAKPWERVALVAGGVLLFYAGVWTDAAGLLITTVVLVLHLNRRPPAPATTDVI